MTSLRSKNPRVAVIIPAGGSGSRFGAKTPKQFLRLINAPILLHTIQAFAAHPDVADIVIVGSAAHLRRIQSMVDKAKVSKVRAVVEGGASRQASVWAGLCAVDVQNSIVLVHDAVRPFVEGALISQVVAAAVRWGAAVAAVPSLDTILWEGKPQTFTKALDRSRLWNVQTPQGFRRTLLVRAHKRAQRSGFVGTDEASLILKLGKQVRIVPSTARNIKITTKEDLKIAVLFMKTENGPD